MMSRISWVVNEPVALLYSAIHGDTRAQAVAAKSDELQSKLTAVKAQFAAVPNSFTAAEHQRAQRVFPFEQENGQGRQVVLPWLPVFAEIAKRTAASESHSTSRVETLVSELLRAGDANSNGMPAADSLWQGCYRELQLRLQPIRLQWEARGPGMMRIIQQLIGQPLGHSHHVVFLLMPVVGGFGICLPPTERRLEHAGFLFEAVLTDTHPEFSEVLRLAWLITFEFLSTLQREPDDCSPQNPLSGLFSNSSTQQTAVLSLVLALSADGEQRRGEQRRDVCDEATLIRATEWLKIGNQQLAREVHAVWSDRVVR